MKPIFPAEWRVALLLFVLSSVLPTAVIAAQHGGAATVHPLATDAAMEAMKKGGNAVDAAVAAALTLGVVDTHNSGIGGGCFMLVRRADGTFAALDGREMAPAGATRDMFLRDGKADLNLSQTGPLASGVPGSLAVYDYAIRNYGKLKLRDHLLAAAKIAEEGFTVTKGYASRLASVTKEINEFPASRAIFLHEDGTPYKAGEVLKQPDLAKTYRAVAEHGIDWFYKGPFAKAAGEWMKKNGGVMTEEDFAHYEMKQREPLKTKYRGYQIVGFPPPSSGGVHVAQILNILDHFDLKKMGAGSADYIHVTTEAMKLAFADRAYWLGDPDFAKVPRGLVSGEYAAELAKKIHMNKATPVPQHNEPAKAQSDVFGKHTTHFSTADDEGNWVACTATINTSYGSKVVVPGTGVVLNNQMDDFSAQPGVPNHFGLVGNEANAVAAGKRPLSSMSPTIVLTSDGKPILSVGAAGGPTIISQTLLAIINVIDFGMDVKGALAAGRFHNQWSPDELRIEKRVPEAVRSELEKRGHTLRVMDAMPSSQAVGRGSDGKFSAAHDPRNDGKSATR